MTRRNMRRSLGYGPTNLMPALAGIKAGRVHFPAFMADSSAISTFSLESPPQGLGRAKPQPSSSAKDRATQYSRDRSESPEKPRRTGSPAFAEDDSEAGTAPPYAFFFTSLTLEKLIPSARSRV